MYISNGNHVTTLIMSSKNYEYMRLANLYPHFPLQFTTLEKANDFSVRCTEIMNNQGNPNFAFDFPDN